MEKTKPGRGTLKYTHTQHVIAVTGVESDIFVGLGGQRKRKLTCQRKRELTDHRLQITDIRNIRV